MKTKATKPLVSIIMPAYNDEKYIKDSIKSVLNQTYDYFELIIVDDGSSDNTAQCVRAFNDNRIRFFHYENNNGAAFARNIALSNAKGDYVAFLDADDLWKPNKLEKQVQFMVDNNYNMSCTYYEVLNDDGEHQHILVKAPKKISHFHFLCGNSVGCLTVIYKKNIYPNLQIPNDIKKRNDYALWIKLSERTKCYCLKKSLAFYRRRKSNSISSTKKRKLLKYHIEMYQKLLKWYYLKALFFSVLNIFVNIRNRAFLVRKT